jgi:PKHD-type hydroxylase
LSITLLLNEPGIDFEGGNFEINKGSPTEVDIVDMKKGMLIAFPSFLIHRVAPVTKGTRKSIVIWVQGPKFR